MTVKKLLFFLFISNPIFCQIFSENDTNGSITISPKGIRSKANSTSNVALGNNTLLNDTASFNTAIGALSLMYNTSGVGNTAIGFSSLNKNRQGSYNLAAGYNSLFKNTVGYNNVALGYQTLYENITGNNNVAISIGALFNNINGIGNIALGNGALYSNTEGNGNVSIGIGSGGSNTIGVGNVTLGVSTLYRNTTGSYNVAIGSYAGGVNILGSKNTFVGQAANASTGNLENATAIGYNAIVDASNKVRIGDVNVTVIEGQVPWSNPSDRRLKENINYTSRLGLSFITRLQTVSYNYTADQNKTRHDGFIAQDVEKVMKDLGVPFSGLKKSGDGTYSLAYSDFVMPLVNAVKEQQLEIEKLKNQVADLEKLKEQTQVLLSSIEDIKAELARMRKADNKTLSK